MGRRFLVDAQLPPRLAKHLRSRGVDAKHISEVGMDDASDQTIVRYAIRTRSVIITKDADFTEILSRSPYAPPIVWIRVGNTRTQTLLEMFDRNLSNISTAIEEGERIVEIR